MEKSNRIKELLAFQPLKYCAKRTGDFAKCANVATWQVRLCNKSDIDKNVRKELLENRCDKHKLSSTSCKKVFQVDELDQCFALQKVNDVLKFVIGKTITSTRFKGKLTAKYKKDNGGVMCFDELKDRWVYVYYYQISEVF